MKQTRNAEAGFSLIEVLIAVAIFAFGSLSVVSMMHIVIEGNERAQLLSEAVAAGRSEMERIMALDSGQINGCSAASCGSATSCPANCLRIFSVEGNDFDHGQSGGVRFQVQNQRATVGDKILITVKVKYPRDENKRAIDVGGTGFVDCQLKPELCHTVIFYGQRF